MLFCNRPIQFITAQDKSYLLDKNTFIVYLRMGDRIDQIPMRQLLHNIREKMAKKVVLSFVMHFGEWTTKDYEEAAGVKPPNGQFAFTYDAMRENYLFLWDFVQRLRTAVPDIEIVLRSSEKQDEDLALYVSSPNLLYCACGGFERLIMKVRNTTEGVLEEQIYSALAANGISTAWVQYGDEERGGLENGSSVQYLILLSLGWYLYGFYGVLTGRLNIMESMNKMLLKSSEEHKLSIIATWRYGATNLLGIYPKEGGGRPCRSFCFCRSCFFVGPRGHCTVAIIEGRAGSTGP